jgi:hypothetical protein
MNSSTQTTLVLRILGALAMASIAWVVLGFLATAPLGRIFGWSGHPSIPAAPAWVYLGLYLVVLPVICLAGAWKVAGWVVVRFRNMRRTAPP